MTTKSLLETATLVEAPSEGPWTIQILSEGKGSSGIYNAELLEKYHHAFNDTLSFENHPVGWDGPESRNFLQIVGQVIGETWVDTDERGKSAIRAKWEPDPDHRERLARYKKKLGMSIYIEGDGHVDEDGEFVVDSFNEHDPYKSVDVVLAAGRGGKFMESMRSVYDNRRAENTDTIVEEVNPSGSKGDSGLSKESKMDEKAIEAINALTAEVSALVSVSKTKAEESAQAEADEKAIAAAREEYSTAVEAIESAREHLFPSQVKTLMAEAKDGKDVAPLIEQAKTVFEEAMAAATAEDETSTGRVLGENAKVTQYGAWS